jgi:hypothetical protein
MSLDPYVVQTVPSQIFYFNPKYPRVSSLSTHTHTLSLYLYCMLCTGLTVNKDCFPFSLLTDLFLTGSKKHKAVPLQAWSGPESSRKLRFPDFMTQHRMVIKLSALRTGSL